MQCHEPTDDHDMATVLMLIPVSTSARRMSANMQANRLLLVRSLTASLQVSSGTQYNCYLIYRKFRQYDCNMVHVLSFLCMYALLSHIVLLVSPS